MAEGADALRAKIRTMIAKNFSECRVNVASKPTPVSIDAVQALRESIIEHVAAGWCDAICEVYPVGMKRAALVAAAKRRAFNFYSEATVETIQKLNIPGDELRARALYMARNNPDTRRAVLGLDTKLGVN